MTQGRNEYQRSEDNREAVERIVNGFAHRVGRAVQAHSWTLPVHNRAHQQPAYHLVLFSRHKDGLWLFGEASSLAQERWRKECLPAPDDDALFNDVDLFDKEEEARQKEWVSTIKRNVEGLLREQTSFTIDTYHNEVMAGVLGLARQKHIRTAVKELYREGKTGCRGVGDVPALRIDRGSRSV